MSLYFLVMNGTECANMCADPMVTKHVHISCRIYLTYFLERGHLWNNTHILKSCNLCTSFVVIYDLNQRPSKKMMPLGFCSGNMQFKKMTIAYTLFSKWLPTLAWNSKIISYSLFSLSLHQFLDQNCFHILSYRLTNF